MSSAEVSQPKLTFTEKFGYGIGAMGEGMSFNLVNSFLMLYCTDILGILPGFIATLFFFARIWDAVNDPMMGTIAENTRTRWGKHRPWVLAGALLNAVVLILIFNPSLARAGNPNAYIAAMYVLFGMTYTIIDVPYYAYAAAFTDLSERDQIATIPRILGSAGTIGIPALTLLMVSKLSPGSQAQGFFRWAFLIAVFYVLCIFVTVGTMKNRQVVKQEKSFSFTDALRTLKNNDQLLIIEVVFVLAFIAVGMTTSVALYYFKYVWQNPGAYASFSLVAGGSWGVFLLAYPFLVKKFSRRNIFIFSMSMPIIGYILMFLIALTTKNVYYMLPAGFLTIGGYGCISILTTVFLVDTVEYGEWKLGYRSETIIFSLLTFIGKFSGAIAALLTGWGLQMGGYRTTVEDIKGLTTGITEQPPGVTTALNILMFAVPPIILAAALILYLKKYKLYGEFIEKITAEVKMRREN